MPVLNIVCVVVMSFYATGHRPGGRTIVLSIARNPFTISSLWGVAWKLLHLPAPRLGCRCST